MLSDLVISHSDMPVARTRFSYLRLIRRARYLLNVLIVAAQIAVSAQAQESDDKQTDAQNLPSVEVNGSVQKRGDDTMAVSTAILTQDDIAKSGARSAAELLQALPAMQGSANAAASVGGAGKGIENASLHGIGAEYTLVLLDGHPMASYSTGSGVNLGSIPLAAIDHIEIVTDVSSSRYGSGAIAGVVNIILRQDVTSGEWQLVVDKPQKPGAGSNNFALSKGFGDTEQDGYNVFLSMSHDEQAALNASQRDFAKTGFMPFSLGGVKYLFTNLSIDTAPAAVTVKQANGATTQFSPDLLINGNCSSGTYKIGMNCEYDYAATVELLPQIQRNSLFATGNVRLTDHATLFSEIVLSEFSLTAQTNAPTQSLNLPLNSLLAQTYVTPYLARFGIDSSSVTAMTMNILLPGAGGAAQDDHTIAKHLVLGIAGKLALWNYEASYVHSQSTEKVYAEGGFLSQNAFNAVLDSGAYNPFSAPDSTSGVLAPVVLHQLIDTDTSTLDVAEVHAATDLFKLPTGYVHLSIGSEIERQAYVDNPSAILQGPSALQPNFTNSIVGNSYTDFPYDTTRTSWAGYGELRVPLTDRLEVGMATRYNKYAAAHSSENFDSNGNPTGAASEGNSFNKTTYQFSLRFQPIDSISLRATYGTGFRAPSLNDITSPLVLSGTTNGQYPCPVSGNDPRAIGCQGFAHYDVLSGGNPNSGSSGLKAEESIQSSIGLRIEPDRHVSFEFDLWQGKLKNNIAILQEQLAFNDPSAYSNLFKSIYDPNLGQKAIAFEEVPVNLASGSAKGIDWDDKIDVASAFGKLKLHWSGSYMIKFEQTYPGGGAESDVGQFGADQNVVFRIRSQLTASLQQSDQVTHSIIANYESGYHDQSFSADDEVISTVNSNGSIGPYVGLSNHEVASYTTFDWQSNVKVNDRSHLTVGIKNLFDRTPPFSLVTSGGGNQTGYDSRYANPLGRQFYLQATGQF